VGAIVDSFVAPTKAVKIAMCGKYTKLADSYVSITEAIHHSAAKVGVQAALDWDKRRRSLRRIPPAIDMLSNYNGIIVLPGFGARGTEGKISAIKYARVNKKPFLGICFGFQLAAIEYARNVLGLDGANSTEVNPNTPHPVIDLLPEQRSIGAMGGTMRLGSCKILLSEGTMLNKLYGASEVLERHRHRYEINPDYWQGPQDAGLAFSGWSTDHRRVEFLELPSHPYFVGSQAHPEFKSRPGKPSPPFYGFIAASAKLA